MKGLLIMLGVAIALSSTLNAKKIQQTICFSKSECDTKYAYGSLGDKVGLCGGKCKG
jgi:hypothetical protein